MSNFNVGFVYKLPAYGHCNFDNEFVHLELKFHYWMCFEKGSCFVFAVFAKSLQGFEKKKSYFLLFKATLQAIEHFLTPFYMFLSSMGYLYKK